MQHLLISFFLLLTLHLSAINPRDSLPVRKWQYGIGTSFIYNGAGISVNDYFVSTQLNLSTRLALEGRLGFSQFEERSALAEPSFFTQKNYLHAGLRLKYYFFDDRRLYTALGVYKPLSVSKTIDAPNIEFDIGTQIKLTPKMNLSLEVNTRYQKNFGMQNGASIRIGF